MEDPTFRIFEKGDIEQIKTLVNSGYNLNWMIRCNDDKIRRPIDIAIINENIELLKFLINSGVEIDLSLNTACKVGNLKIVKILIRNGESPNNHDIDYTYPIHVAAKNGHLNIVNFLITIQNPKLIGTINNFNRTPLDFAIEGKHIEVVKTLIKNGADIKSSEFSPLLKAAINKNFDAINLLLEAGVNANDENENHWTRTGLFGFLEHLKTK